MKTISVLTPTYNRKDLLPKLYDSLANQTDMDFVWIIIDDGSTDETEMLVSEFINQAGFDIIYRKKKNGGKHTALNYGCQFIESPLTFIVDSDDYLTEDAIAIIKEKYNCYASEMDLCGLSFLRGKPTGGYLSDSGVPEEGLKESYVQCRINREIGGDMAEVWITECLKEFPFPEYAGEKFLGEDLVWIRMSEKYKLRYFNNVIYMSDYRDDGLTNNRRKHNIKSPNGCVDRAKAFLESDSKLKVKIKAMLQYQIYGRFAGKKSVDLLRLTNQKVLFTLCYIPARILWGKWNKQYKS